MTRALVQATWDDAPHLSGEQKDGLWASIPPHERDARTKGIPSLGAGKVYPIAEEDVLIDPFELPAYWPRAYGFDADWNRTAAVWGAWDRQSDVVYIYSEHFQRQQPPAVHATAILARGEWMRGAMDPSTHGKISPIDGKRLSEEYQRLGLRLADADNAVEAGIFAVQQRLTRGGLKVFRTCVNWVKEFRIYRRDEETGKVVKENDDLMDATRYLIMTGMRYAIIDPGEWEEMDHELRLRGRDKNTGY